MTIPVTFEVWFKELLKVAEERDAVDLIDQSDPQTYLEYFDEGDSPEDAFDSEWESQDIKDDE